MSELASNRMLVELEEFASFTSAEQRYIRRSLEVAFARADATDHWARGLAEADCIKLQARAYDLIDEIMLFVQPVVLGRGIGIFGNQPASLRPFARKEVLKLGGGFNLLWYEKLRK